MQCALMAYQFDCSHSLTALHNSSYGVDCCGTRTNLVTQRVPTKRHHQAIVLVLLLVLLLLLLLL